MTTVVLMAGGKGLRLHPLTDHESDRFVGPKPLLKLGTKPMLQEIIEHFSDQGFSNFVIIVNYKADMIVDYFGDGEDFGIKITYIHEDEPLGTAGGLRMLRRQDKPIIVSNADIITEVDYKDLLAEHDKYDAPLTACLALHQIQIPYGVAKIERDQLLGVEEKPIKNFPVLAGIYVLQPKTLGEIPRAGSYDMTDLITKLARNRAVNFYQLKNHWQDIGTFQDFTGARK